MIFSTMIDEKTLFLTTYLLMLGGYIFLFVRYFKQKVG
jgi:hypothetical protein